MKKDQSIHEAVVARRKFNNKQNIKNACEKTRNENAHSAGRKK